ncbi:MULTISPECIES: hypothetical protein [Niastella]|uniref:Uncharacterized protein n=1 Tax=Niastella soli TaxID=2821487 RepID=A0ABS3Z5J5_9BACT|nr:hypothetical protein [Niastella soli]MBO9204940.1 hypothetical protein [Niastella soli]
MWKIIKPGARVSLGDTVRFLPSSNSSKIYQVFKIEQHYFEIIVKLTNDNCMENPVRRIIRYMDIGYHIGMEVWTDPSQSLTNGLDEGQSNPDLQAY